MRRLTDCCWSRASVSRWLCSSWVGGSPSSRLSPGNVPLCGSETLLCWAVCSTQVWTLVSQTCITLYVSSVEGWWVGLVGVLRWIVPCVGYSVLLLHARMMLTSTVWHLLSLCSFINAFLCSTCPLALRNVDVHLFIRNTMKARLSLFPSSCVSLFLSAALKTLHYYTELAEFLREQLTNSTSRLKLEKKQRGISWMPHHPLWSARRSHYLSSILKGQSRCEGVRLRFIVSSRLRSEQLATPALMRFTSDFSLIHYTDQSCNIETFSSLTRPWIHAAILYIPAQLTALFKWSAIMCHVVVKALFFNQLPLNLMGKPVLFSLNMNWALVQLC